MENVEEKPKRLHHWYRYRNKFGEVVACAGEVQEVWKFRAKVWEKDWEDTELTICFSILGFENNESLDISSILCPEGKDGLIPEDYWNISCK